MHTYWSTLLATQEHIQTDIPAIPPFDLGVQPMELCISETNNVWELPEKIKFKNVYDDNVKVVKTGKTKLQQCIKVEIGKGLTGNYDRLMAFTFW